MSTDVRAPSSQATSGIRVRFHPNRRGWTLLAVTAVLVVSFAVDVAASAGRVRPGVRAGSLDLGGTTLEEAERLISARAEKLASSPATFSAKGEELTISPDDVGWKPDAKETYERVRGVARDGNIFVRFWHRVRTYFGSTDVGWAADVDRKAVDEVVDGWAERFDDASVEASIEADGLTFKAVKPSSGRRLDQREAGRTVRRALSSWPRRAHALPFAVSRARTDLADAEAAAKRATELVDGGPITLTSPQGNVDLDPEEIATLLVAEPVRDGRSWELEVRFSADRIASALAERMAPFEQEPRSAKIIASGGSVSIEAGQDGLTFDPKATAANLTKALNASAPRTAEVAFQRRPPDLTTEEAKALGIKERVSTFTTNHPCCAPRVKNIHRIAELVDGAIIPPGATFSLNQHVGRRTTDRGFVLAPMIFDGEYKDDVGGGVSQFATTFYNAIFFGGYQFVSDKTHSYYISRYPPGREATISWPRPDLAFRNNSPAGILVRTSYSSTSITVSFYGDKQGKTVEATASDRTNFTEPKEQRKVNPALPPGAERVVQRGSQGFDITVTRIIKFSDGEVKRERIFTRYKPEPRIIEVGPAAPEPTPGGSSPSPDPDPGGPGEPPQPTPPPSTQEPQNP